MLVSVLVGGSLSAQESTTNWDGHWVAEGTLFQVEVQVEGKQVSLTQVESMGFVWTSQPGIIANDVLQVKVAYGGVTGLIQAELQEDNSALVFAATCEPEFMVVCALAKDRQALFRKLPED